MVAEEDVGLDEVHTLHQDPLEVRALRFPGHAVEEDKAFRLPLNPALRLRHRGNRSHASAK